MVSRRLKAALGFLAVGVVLLGITASRLDALAIKAATTPKFWCNGACYITEALELIGAILGIILTLAGGIALVEYILPRD